MTSKKVAERRVRIRKLNRALTTLFPEPKIELNYTTPWELLVAVQLSAQSTDKNINKITEKLFKKYQTFNDYIRAASSEKGRRTFEQDIFASGFYRNKAKNILGAALMLREEFGGVVPQTIEEILRLPGVARKTATVVLAEAFGVVAGITVDTHVIRFVSRYDLSDYTDPAKIEKDLMELLPKKEWRLFTHRVIHYGRYLAPARAYDVSKDPLVKVYPPAGAQFRAYKIYP